MERYFGAIRCRSRAGHHNRAIGWPFQRTELHRPDVALPGAEGEEEPLAVGWAAEPLTAPSVQLTGSLPKVRTRNTLRRVIWR